MITCGDGYLRHRYIGILPANSNITLIHGCANHDTEGKRFKFPHPLVWRNESSPLDQWRTMYFPLALFVYTVCCRRTEQCFSVLRTHKSEVVDGSSGRRYVTDHWHNVPLLSAPVLDKRKEWGSMSSPFLTEPVALWEHLSLHTQTRVLQIELLNIPYLK